MTCLGKHKQTAKTLIVTFRVLNWEASHKQFEAAGQPLKSCLLMCDTNMLYVHVCSIKKGPAASVTIELEVHASPGAAVSVIAALRAITIGEESPLSIEKLVTAVDGTIRLSATFEETVVPDALAEWLTGANAWSLVCLNRLVCRCKRSHLTVLLLLLVLLLLILLPLLLLLLLLFLLLECSQMFKLDVILSSFLFCPVRFVRKEGN